MHSPKPNTIQKSVEMSSCFTPKLKSPFSFQNIVSTQLLWKLWTDSEIHRQSQTDIKERQQIPKEKSRRKKQEMPVGRGRQSDLLGHSLLKRVGGFLTRKLFVSLEVIATEHHGHGV